MESDWRNAEHRSQWQSTLSTYAESLNSIPVDKIATDDVLRLLTPIWAAKPETASRVRGRIESVLHAAKARGHLDHVLPKRKKLSRGHHAAMPYDEVPAFMRRCAHAAALPPGGSSSRF